MSHPGIIFLDETPRHVRHEGPYPRRCTRRKSNGFGTLGCLFSVLGIFTFGLASPIGLGLSLVGMLRRPRGAATVGTILGGLGTAFLLLVGWGVLSSVDAATNARNLARTEDALQAAVVTVESFEHENGHLPEGVDGNKLLINAELNDGWGQSIRYEPLDKDSFQVRSAGPDETFDTSDDLTRS